MHSETIIRPRYGETDQMGVIYHSNYFRYFEVARTDYFKAMGFAYRKLEEEGVLFPVLECNCKFISPARYDDEIIVKAQLGHFKGARFRLNYEITRMDDDGLKVLVKGFTEHAFASKDLKPLNIKKSHPHLYEKLIKAMEENAHEV